MNGCPAFVVGPGLVCAGSPGESGRGVLGIEEEVEFVEEDCRAVASREGSRREKETSGGEREMEVNEDKVAPWCVPSSNLVITIATGYHLEPLTMKNNQKTRIVRFAGWEGRVVCNGPGVSIA